MTRLIGRIWKGGDTRRRPVLMGRGLDGYFDIRALALCSFEGPGRGWSRPVSGGYGEGETPLPIPNRAVKPLSADGTWPARAWESRSPPVFQFGALHSAIDGNDVMAGAERAREPGGGAGSGSTSNGEVRAGREGGSGDRAQVGDASRSGPQPA